MEEKQLVGLPMERSILPIHHLGCSRRTRRDDYATLAWKKISPSGTKRKCACSRFLNRGGKGLDDRRKEELDAA